MATKKTVKKTTKKTPVPQKKTRAASKAPAKAATKVKKASPSAAPAKTKATPASKGRKTGKSPSKPAKTKATGTGKASRVKPAKAESTKDKPEVPPTDEKTKALVLGARKRTGTPVIFKKPKAKVAPVVFTMDDVNEVLATRKEEKPSDTKKKQADPAEAGRPAKKTLVDDVVVEHRNHSAASIADILGFNPAERKARQTEENVPRKWIRYYRALIELRDHVRSGLDMHAADTLMRAGNDIIKDGGKDMVDASSDSFDRDFALSLVSNEQEALSEIEEAIHRIFSGTYGICEVTRTAIDKERLEAVPFTRYSLEGQRELEKNRRYRNSRGGSVGVFGDSDDNISFSDDDSDS